MPEVYDLRQCDSPVLLSFPHDGTRVPEPIHARLTEHARELPDTDWHVFDLYEFMQGMNVSYVRARISRYVADLNRPPDGTPLYPDRPETGICPLHSFDGGALYRLGTEPDEPEIRERLQRYWAPYHECLAAELERLKALHGFAILWDAHSIRGCLPRLFEGVLPDLNLGTADRHSCGAVLAERLEHTLQGQHAYSYVWNDRFKGGYITRRYGNPAAGVHAVQLEINQSAYLADGARPALDPARARGLRKVLRRLLGSLIEAPTPARTD